LGDKKCLYFLIEKHEVDRLFGNVKEDILPIFNCSLLTFTLVSLNFFLLQLWWRICFRCLRKDF